MKRLRLILWALVAVTLALLGLFAWQLAQPKDDFVKSAMIGKPVEPFSLAPAVEDRPGLASADLADGRPKLLNVFASWCVPCIAEAPLLAALERQGAVIVGINIRDKPEDVAVFLANYGNPFARIGADTFSKVQVSLGSSGAPETFVIDGAGTIRYQHLGEIRERDVPVLLDELRKAGG